MEWLFPVKNHFKSEIQIINNPECDDEILIVPICIKYLFLALGGSDKWGVACSLVQGLVSVWISYLKFHYWATDGSQSDKLFKKVMEWKFALTLEECFIIINYQIHKNSNFSQESFEVEFSEVKIKIGNSG